MQVQKRCGRCGEIKPLAAFNRSVKSKDGYQWNCRACYKLYNKSRYTYDMEASRSKHLKRSYGLTPEEYQTLFAAQKGVCAACGLAVSANDSRTGKIKNLQVDHCHRTRRIRALLCKECNNALGLLHDDPARIRLLLQYAELHHSSNDAPYISSSEGANP